MKLIQLFTTLLAFTVSRLGLRKLQPSLRAQKNMGASKNVSNVTYIEIKNMNLVKVFSIIVFMLFTQRNAFALDNPVYQNGALTIPSVNTPEQVGKYLDIKFSANQDGSWKLNSFKESGVHSALAPVDAVALVTVTASPVQVFLNIKGQFTSGCGKVGQINTRLDKNTFNVIVNDGFDYINSAVSCAAVMVSFEKVIALPVFELKAGTYDFYVNGKRFGNFTLDTDNNLNISIPPCCKK